MRPSGSHSADGGHRGPRRVPSRTRSGRRQRLHDPPAMVGVVVVLRLRRRTGPACGQPSVGVDRPKVAARGPEPDGAASAEAVASYRAAAAALDPRLDALVALLVADGLKVAEASRSTSSTCLAGGRRRRSRSGDTVNETIVLDRDSARAVRHASANVAAAPCSSTNGPPGWSPQRLTRFGADHLIRQLRTNHATEHVTANALRRFHINARRADGSALDESATGGTRHGAACGATTKPRPKPRHSKASSRSPSGECRPRTKELGACDTDTATPVALPHTMVGRATNESDGGRAVLAGAPRRTPRNPADAGGSRQRTPPSDPKTTIHPVSARNSGSDVGVTRSETLSTPLVADVGAERRQPSTHCTFSSTRSLPRRPGDIAPGCTRSRPLSTPSTTRSTRNSPADGPVRLLDEIALCHPTTRPDPTTPTGTARPHHRSRIPAGTDRARPDHRDRPHKYQRPARRGRRTIPGAPSTRSRPRLRDHRPRTRRTLNITVSATGIPTPKSGPR